MSIRSLLTLAAPAAAVVALAAVALAAEPAYEVVSPDAPGEQARVREVIFAYDTMDDLAAAVALLKQPLGRDTFFQPVDRVHSEGGMNELKYHAHVSVISEAAYTAKVGDFSTALFGPDYDVKKTFTRAATIKRSGDALLVDYLVESPPGWEHPRRFHVHFRLGPGQAILMPVLVSKDKFAGNRFFNGENRELVGAMFTFDEWIAAHY